MEQNKKIVSLGIMSEEEFKKIFKKNQQVQPLGKMTDGEFIDFKNRLLENEGKEIDPTNSA